MVIFGTLLTTINKPMFAASGLVFTSFGAIAALYWITFGKIFDRMSKGIREAPSKALIGELATQSGESAAAAFSLRQSMATFGALFGAAVAAAGLAGLVQFSPAVAAFLVGLLLTGELAEVARRRLDPLRELLAAIFFVYFGLSTNAADLPAVLLPAAGLALVTIGTKFVTGWFAADTVEGGTISKFRAGALLSARGEFSVIIAGLVAVSGVLPPTFQAFVAAYVLITATAAPFLARWAEPFGWWWEQRPGRVRS
jgi:CPA2 family monovalent cation:H+ antiporter-2